MPDKQRLNFNQNAPDAMLLEPSGKQVKLSDLWLQQPLLLAFARHSGCTQCKEMLDELTGGREKIEAAGLRIVVVLQGTPEANGLFAQEFAPGLLWLADPERKAYHAFGLERGSLFQTFLNPNVWSAVSRSRKKGYRVEQAPAGQDAMQMSGIFIIGRDGRIELPYYFDHIADHPPLELLIKGVLSTRWDQPFDGPVGPGLDNSDSNSEKL